VNALYHKYKQAAVSWSQAGLAAPIDLFTDAVMFAFVDTALYTVDLANDQFLSDIPVGAIVATGGPLLNKTVVPGGIFDADDFAVPGFAGPTVEALVVYMDTGVPGTSPLVEYVDQASGTLPFTPNGTPKIVKWPAPGLFQI
jgi:hypothetical protein